MKQLQTKIKFCGLTKEADILAVNILLPDYIGFVFAPKSRRYVTPAQAKELKAALNPRIQAVGVFVNEAPETIAALLHEGTIDLAQLHGQEDASYIRHLRALTDRPLIQAFRIDRADDVARAMQSCADYILLDSGSGGTGIVFDWHLLKDISRPWFLAGGLYPENVGTAITDLHPYAVDVSSGIETDRKKDIQKMKSFIAAVRSAEADTACISLDT
ncbi:MAG: phosphoribosylanthranilate isomerase [Eubacterium sp.]|nr:phosphoribosylanthranilate isomerase [Eubacterium sp.]